MVLYLFWTIYSDTQRVLHWTLYTMKLAHIYISMYTTCPMRTFTYTITDTSYASSMLLFAYPVRWSHSLPRTTYPIVGTDIYIVSLPLNKRGKCREKTPFRFWIPSLQCVVVITHLQSSSSFRFYNLVLGPAPTMEPATAPAPVPSSDTTAPVCLGGRVKMFHHNRGYGFITAEEQDYFVHRKVILRSTATTSPPSLRDG